VVEVIATGIYSSIQDQGRFGFRNIGVPISGVMDNYSANLANALLNNNKQCAVLETTLVGPVLKFHQDTFISVTGAKCLLKINDGPRDLNTVHEIFKGDVLSMGKTTSGMRNYLAVSGGFQTPLVLNSRSYFAGISKNQTIRKGEYIKIIQPVSPILNRTKITPVYIDSKQHSIEVSKGPEFELLDEKSKEILFQNKFILSSQSNRMAYPLKSVDGLNANEIISSSVQPGTVQLTPSGKPIILMRDCQTTGGYSRVLQLTEQATNLLAQKRPDESIYFTLK